ncbi:hypothetical protein ILUMI_26045 [Ignelater luminosus]|uniref:WD repeat-containing protein 63 n=1 Tax=Ignelater luminosus TaxID=2038154 RepID=A0A8K0C4R7_IGNLU|nr:hypothetical protein ILUMI_26045 [Ignelater luminosus]
MDEAKPAPSKIQQTPLQSQSRLDNVVSEQVEEPKKPRKYRRVRKIKPEDDLLPKDIKDIPGVRTIVISTVIQNVLGCIVGTHVTSENPWKFVSKEALTDNLELHEESSEFLPIKNEILTYPLDQMLLVYVPSESSQVDEFHVCTTVKATDVAIEVMNTTLQQREERLNNAVFKTPGEWISLGSELEVEELQEKNYRPLLEVELESEYPVITARNIFKYRLAEHAKDGYTNLLAPRQTFSNLFKKRIDVATQVAPAVAESEAQTTYTFPKNISTQYHFEYAPPAPPTKELKANVKSFLDNRWDTFSDALYVNSYINFYNDDYKGLSKNFKRKPPPQVVKPHATFAEPHICKRKEISCHSWHRLYTGTFAVAYGDVKPSDYIKGRPNQDDVLKAMYDVTPVLLWSFKDTLHPRLLLETPREVTALAFCPYDENILVGGCVNGQIIVWDITNKLKGVEEEEILSESQRRYRILMSSLVKWLKNTKDPKIVRPTVVSELEYSHQCTVTSVLWLPPFREINKNGQVKNLPEDDDKPGYQFVTSSRDGSLLAWNLRSKPIASAGGYRPQRKLRRLKKRPSALTVDVSPLRALHRLLKPSFRINVFAPNTLRPLPVTTIDILNFPLKYIEENPKPNHKFDITERLVFKPVLERFEFPLDYEFAAGTVEGDVIIATWEGFDFNAGEVVNKETAKFSNFVKYHDGPVLSISRSPTFSDLLLTVGGKVFAIWKTGFLGKPLMWRRNKVRYAHGSWNILRSGLFRLMRTDGCYELWHLKIRSDRCIKVNLLSNLSIDATSLHPFNLEHNIIGLVDGKGTFRTFLIAKEFDTPLQEDTLATETILNREVERKLKFAKWQEEWPIKNSTLVTAMKQRNTIVQQEKAEKLKQEKEEHEAAAEEEQKQKEKQLEKEKTPEPGQFKEWYQRKWNINEKERMKKVILKKKALDVNTLQKQQAPLLKAEEEIKLRKKKQEVRLSKANELFEDAVAMLFSDAIGKKSTPPPDAYAGGDSMEVKAFYFEKYKETAESCEEIVNKRQYRYHFNWLKIIETGRERRKVLDGYYKRDSHKLRIINEKKLKESEELAKMMANRFQPETKTSLESIDYEIIPDEDDQ